MNLLMRPITESDAVAITEWRIDARFGLRTTEMCNPDKQRAWYASLQQSGCQNRYWSFRMQTKPTETELRAIACQNELAAVGGLTGISFDNRNGEISLIVEPHLRMKGIGTQCVDMLLEEAFLRMGLKTVYGEVYVGCNESGANFWCKVGQKYGSVSVLLPNRKFWDGQFWDGNYFSIDAEDYRRVKHD